MRKISVQEVVDKAHLNPFHWTILWLCTLIIIVDGYDLIVYGVVLPLLMQEWNLTPPQAGFLGSMALFGMMFGALTLGVVADRIGRKKVILLCLISFSIFTFLCACARNPTEFGIYRFIAGAGLGAMFPMIVAVMTEYMPKAIRTTLVALTVSGYAMGGMLAAGLGAWLVPTYGWKLMFYLGLVPLLIVPIVMIALPESLEFLVRKDEKAARQVIQKLSPELALTESDELVRPAAAGGKAPFLEIFREGRALGTIMLGVCFGMCLLMVYGLGNWLPKLMNSAGYPLQSSMLFLMVLNIGGIAGGLLGGYLSDRFNVRKVLMVFYFFAALSLALLGFKTPAPVLYTILFVCGATTIGSQILQYAYSAQHFEFSMRSTGVGFASSLGRIGAILGPMLGGALLAANLGHQTNFLIFAIPGIIAIFAVILVRQPKAKEPELKTVVVNP